MHPLLHNVMLEFPVAFANSHDDQILQSYTPLFNTLKEALPNRATDDLFSNDRLGQLFLCESITVGLMKEVVRAGAEGRRLSSSSSDSAMS